MQRLILFLFALVALLMSSCQHNLKQVLRPDASGTPYDLYLVMEESLKSTPLNDTLHAIFEYPMECTPNGDPYFHVRHLSPENYQSSVIRIVANVVMIDIDPSNASEPVITLDHDRYATHQTIIRMHAKSSESLAEYLPQMQERLRQVFVKSELNRRMAVLKEENRHDQQERLQRLQDASLCIPMTMNVTCRPEADSTFFWVSDNLASKQSHLVVYSVPYINNDIFTLEGAVAVRDSVLGANIRGTNEDECMETNQHVILPEYKGLLIDSQYVGELRGMWRMKNGMMAGPFVCHMHLDRINQRVVFVEGFCYAPNESKRLLIRNLEACLYTLRLPSDSVLPEVEVLL